MSDCTVVASGFYKEAEMFFDTSADLAGNPLLAEWYVAAPLLTATFSQFPSIVEFQMNSARAVTNALVVANEGPSPACVFVSLNPVALPSGNNNFGIPFSPGQHVLLSKPPGYQSPPSTAPVLTPLYIAGAALLNLATITLRFGKVSVGYRFSLNGVSNG